MRLTDKEKVMKHLFIGGCRDGEWIDIEPREYVRMASPSELMTFPVSASPVTETISMKVDEYRRTSLADAEKRYHVYVLADGKEPSVIESLIGGYKA